MTLLEQLQGHKGGLIRMKTQLYWHAGRGWDGNPGRVCILLDATRAATSHAYAYDATARLADIARGDHRDPAAVHLLIDGSPQWVCVDQNDMEVLNDVP